MKKFFVLLIAMLFMALWVSAQDAGLNVDAGFTFDVATFTGIVAFIAMVITQFAKVIPIVDQKAGLKILLSAFVGIVAALVFWKIGWAVFLLDYEWWKVAIIGLFAGLSAGKFFDIIKSLVYPK